MLEFNMENFDFGFREKYLKLDSSSTIYDTKNEIF